MGAWGEGPYDNDTAADWFYHLDKIGLYSLIEEGLNSKWDEEVRAAAWLVQRLAVSAYVYNVDKLDAHRELAVSKLKAMLDNQDYLDCWVDEESIRKELEQQIHEIENPESSPGLLERIAVGLNKE